jgi:lipopolysaccharide/colanic/teichoic acid biosynthesis glycosyltransferase
MWKRAFDVGASALALIALSPILLLSAVGIALSSPGPVIYKARRAGLGGREFTIHKFRTMHARKPGEQTAAITGVNDPRIFRLGSILRKTKIDELPQLWDVLRGEMSVIGPRPEDLTIVREHYTPFMMETLTVRPGLASPGSIFNYTHGEEFLDDADPEGSYIRRLLPIKMALEWVYVQRMSLGYDMRIVSRTVSTIVQIMRGRKHFEYPEEMRDARQILADKMPDYDVEAARA